jgi:uncharacterized damage-inducible protein DinB
MTESLLDYDSWAHGQVRNRIEPINEEKFNQKLDESVGSLKDKLQHLRWAEEIWSRRIQGESPDSSFQLEDFVAPQPFFDAWQASRDGYISRIRSEIQNNPAREVHYITTRGEEFRQPLWQIALHLVNHGTFHRGQVSSMMNRLTGEPIPLDMILFHRS